MRNEKTSERVAAIAGRILRLRGRLQILPNGRLCDYHTGLAVSRADIRALAASCLTQSAEKPWVTRRNAAAKKPVKRKRARRK